MPSHDRPPANLVAGVLPTEGRALVVHPGPPPSRLPLDVDGCTSIDDLNGHDVGGTVLRELAARLAHRTRLDRGPACTRYRTADVDGGPAGT